MPIFVHLTSQRNLASIRRSGIGRRSKYVGFEGVYAMPVTRNFYVAHQWLRELRRWRNGTVVGVYFRLPDDEPVTIGHYNSAHVSMTAAEAVRLMMSVEHRDPVAERKQDGLVDELPDDAVLPSSPEGFEVIVPRRIKRSEIIRIKRLPQVVGWRYEPGAHGKPPCTCLCCGGRGQYGVQRLLRRVEEAEAGGKPTKIIVFGRGERSLKRVQRLRRSRGLS